MSAWKKLESGLFISLKFSDFKTAFKFMGQVAELAETANHHPHWINVYDRVDITLNTHDAGGRITDQDRSLAKQIDQVLQGFDFQVISS